MDKAVSRGVGLLGHGAHLDRAHKHAEAYAYYCAGLDELDRARTTARRTEMKERIGAKMIEFIARSEEIRSSLGHEQAIAAVERYESRQYEERQKRGVEPKSAKTSRDPLVPSKPDEALVGVEPVASSPGVQWSDIAGLEAAKETLKEAVILPNLYPSLFSGKRAAWKAVLLYGPPGTGKSYLAKAVATEAKASFFSVSSSDLLSKWLGESEKQVRQLFATARNEAPSVIFVDEIDSLCGDRNTADNTKRVVTEFLAQMDGFSSENHNVFVLAATNFPLQLDIGIRRRFEKRIYIGLPDTAARAQLIRLHLGATAHTIADSHFDFLAKRTDGFSGADISILVRDALMLPVRRMITATHFRLVDCKWLPCQPSDDGAEQRSMQSIGDAMLGEMPITAQDFLPALKTMHASVSPQDLRQYEEFRQQY